MRAIRLQRQRFGKDHGIERQGRIKMREKCAAARGLEAQGVAEPCWIDRDEHEIGLARKPLCGGLLQLRAKREMNKAIGEIGRPAGEAAAFLRLAPQGERHNFVYQIHCMGHIERKRDRRAGLAGTGYSSPP